MVMSVSSFTGPVVEGMSGERLVDDGSLGDVKQPRLEAMGRRSVCDESGERMSCRRDTRRRESTCDGREIKLKGRRRNKGQRRDVVWMWR